MKNIPIEFLPRFWVSKPIGVQGKGSGFILAMKNIPIEFLPRFWVSKPIGVQGKGSGFILAENIYSVFSIDYILPQTNSLSVINIKQEELKKDNYLQAIIRLITESWLDNYSLIIIGDESEI